MFKLGSGKPKKTLTPEVVEPPKEAPIEEATTSDDPFTQDFLVSTLVDRSIVETRKQEKYLRPSMVHGCDRMNYFWYHRYAQSPESYDTRMARILDTGTALHKVFQDYLQESRHAFFAREVVARQKIHGVVVKGHADGLLIPRDFWCLAQKAVLVELKTKSPSSWSSLKEPEPHHVMQASLYAMLFGPVVGAVHIVYWCKGTSKLKEYWYSAKDLESAQEVTSKRIEFLAKRVLNQLPVYNPRQCEPTFCNFTKVCSKLNGPVLVTEEEQNNENEHQRRPASDDRP